MIRYRILNMGGHCGIKAERRGATNSPAAPHHNRLFMEGRVMATSHPIENQPQEKPLPEEKYGRWTPIRIPDERASNGDVLVLCRCDCGAEKMIRRYALLAHGTNSCGCLRSEVARSRTTHGHARKNKVSNEFTIWAGMIQRCTDPKSTRWDIYGGRGITVCEKWMLSFADFLADMGKRPSLKHSLDRYPNKDGNYEPGNVRWATASQQARNTRANRIIKFNGASMCAVEWSEIIGIPASTICLRLRRGWSIENALTVRPEDVKPGPKPKGFYA